MPSLPQWFPSCRPRAAVRRVSLTLAAAALAATLTAPAARADDAARIPDCTEAVVMTSFLGYVDCIGAFDQRPPVQNAGLVPYLDLYFPEYGSWEYWGSSERLRRTLFANDPWRPTGTLRFDEPLEGVWGVALKSGTGSSVYVYDFGTPTAALPYSTAGTSLNRNDMPQGLSHANLFRPADMTVVPEPSTYALLATGLVAVVGVTRRRQRR
jgi:hypothetical protein